MPDDPRLTRLARRIATVNRANRSRARKARAQASGGSDATSFPIYASYRALIAVDPNDSSLATYRSAMRTRIEAVATPYLPLNLYASINSMPATKDYAGNTAALDWVLANYPEFAGAPVMFDMEDEWAAIYKANPSDSDIASKMATWEATSYIDAEFARQGVNGGTATGATIAEFRAVLTWFFRDLLEYAITTKGASRATMYLQTWGPGSAMYANGIPRDGCRSSAPSSLRSWWQANASTYRGIRTLFDDHYEMNGSYQTVRDIANDGGVSGIPYHKTPIAAGNSLWMPSPSGFESMIPSWTDITGTRKDSAGNTVSPDFDSDDYRHYTRNTFAALRGAWIERQSIETEEGLTVNGYRQTDADTFPAFLTSDRSLWDIAMEEVVHTGPPTPETMTSAEYIYWNHVGAVWPDPVAKAADVCSAVVRPEAYDSDAPFVPTAAIWIDDSSYFYWITSYTPLDYSAASAANKKKIAMVRCGLEKMFIGRELVAAAEPVGSNTATDHDTWFAANNLGDAFWKNWDAAKVWWNASTGDQTGLSTSWATTGRLAPYLSTSSNITGAEMKVAIGKWITEYNVTLVERIRAILDANGL